MGSTSVSSVRLSELMAPYDSMTHEIIIPQKKSEKQII